MGVVLQGRFEWVWPGTCQLVLQLLWGHTGQLLTMRVVGDGDIDWGVRGGAHMLQRWL